jgi:FkbM family methyltransferase
MIDLENINNEWEHFLNNNVYSSLSQWRQDLFALFINGNKQDGFFVEFGACDGIELTNTFLLEDKFNWKGILSEPCKYWHDNLKNNRKCIIDTRAVWNKDNSSILFTEVEELRTLSNITEANGEDWAYDIRDKENIRYKVPTVSLTTLLKENNAPKIIDYISIDTEGSEYQILEAFNFNEYEFNCITIEHNGSQIREQINNILTQNNYKLVLGHDPHSSQDDWYIKNYK